MNIVTRLLLELQEMSLLAARAVRGLFKKPRYIPETIAQMDSIGVGSLTIIILTGFFTGGVLTLQTYQTLASYGAVDQLGYLVSISLVRELGPVLTALMVTGRAVSAISAVLGSMGAAADPALAYLPEPYLPSRQNWDRWSSRNRLTRCAPWAPTRFASWWRRD